MFTAVKNWLRRLFGKGGKPRPQAETARTGRGKKLTREERRQIEAAIVRARKQNPKELSAQDSIPYQRMYPDGICRVTDTFYTKTVQFQDINYQLSQNEDKTAIFEGWGDFLNYFDSSIRFQLSFLNLSAAQKGFVESIVIPLTGDGYDGELRRRTSNPRNPGWNGSKRTLSTISSVWAWYPRL